MINQTDSATLLRLLNEKPSIHIYIDVPTAGAFTMPPGNIVAMWFFADLLKAALAMDGVEVLGWAWLGEFNHGCYMIVVEPAMLGVAALLIKAEVENRFSFAAHLVEIVTVPDRESSTVISQAGDGWGTLAQRRVWAIAWSENGTANLTADLARANRFRATIDEQLESMDARLSKIAEEIREQRDEGDEWKGNNSNE